MTGGGTWSTGDGAPRERQDMNPPPERRVDFTFQLNKRTDILERAALFVLCLKGGG